MNKNGKIMITQGFLSIVIDDKKEIEDFIYKLPPDKYDDLMDGRIIDISPDWIAYHYGLEER